MRAQGVDFLGIPASYYARLRARPGCVEEPIEELERLGILVDWDESGYMLQAVTRPVEDRPTLFFEIVQRKGCGGFGAESFRALSEAVAPRPAQSGTGELEQKFSCCNIKRHARQAFSPRKKPTEAISGT